ncbi:SAM-dependent methyltransferase [Actinokineospora soli]|uniref:SAM-dependent methyltransferase n=1 Tax=Actinokineospora soli TaxID=1048753 RepID=A0ABW2TU90_9PSEU
MPGVSPVSAAAPTPLLEAGAVDSVAVTTVESDFAEVRALAAANRTLAVRAPAARTADLVEALRAAGIPDDAPAVVADKVSRPDETVVRTTVGALVAEVKKHNLWRTTLFLIGDTLRTGGKPKAAADEPAPRWTARSWRRPTDEPRKSWAERRAEAAAPEPEPAPEPQPDAQPEQPVERVPVPVGADAAPKPKPARTQPKRPARTAAKRTTKK